MQKAKGKVKGTRMIHEIKRLSGLGLSQRKISAALGISRNTIKKYLASCSEPAAKTAYSAPWAGGIDWTRVKSETELGVCLYHYWEEHIVTTGSASDAAIGYISFWREFKRRYPLIPIDFHKIHPPGERCEMDYKGETRGLGYVDPVTRAFVPCRLFGAILCFSQYVYMRVTPDEKQVSMLASVAKSFEYFRGVPETIAVDNAKAQVTSAHRYDADINPEFFKFANHYNIAPLAMRPGEPKDKNLIENVLGVFWRWIGPKIRKKIFRSIGEINEFVLLHLELFNKRIQRKYGVSRYEKFMNGEQSKLGSLPSTAYEGGDWKKSKVHPDSHIQIDFNFYSVPYEHVAKTLDVRITESSIEVFCDLERVAIHHRRGRTQRGCYTTLDTHLPQKHLAVKEQTPQRTLEIAEAIGLATLQVISDLLISDDHHPFTYLRRCQGIVRLAKRYSNEQLEAACVTALGLHSKKPKLKDIEGIISYNKAGGTIKPVNRRPNPNLRGQESWRTKLN
jgi:transposase